MRKRGMVREGEEGIYMREREVDIGEREDGRCRKKRGR